MERSGGEEAGKEKRLGERSIGGREARQTRLTRLSRWQCRRLVTILSKQSCRRLIFNFLAAEQGSLRSTVGTIPLCAWTGQTMEGRERERKREKGREENGNRFRRIETRVYSKRVKTWQYLQTPTPVFLGDCYTRRETKLDDDIVNARRYKYIYIYIKYLSLLLEVALTRPITRGMSRMGERMNLAEFPLSRVLPSFISLGDIWRLGLEEDEYCGSKMMIWNRRNGEGRGGIWDGWGWKRREWKNKLVDRIASSTIEKSYIFSMCVVIMFIELNLLVSFLYSNFPSFLLITILQSFELFLLFLFFLFSPKRRLV